MERGAARTTTTGLSGGALLLALSFGALSAGCTVVQISEAPGATRIQRHVGFVSIDFPDQSRAAVVETRGFGLVRSPFGFAAGLTHQSIATLDDECRIVLWVEDAKQVAKLVAMVGERNDVCIEQ